MKPYKRTIYLVDPKFQIKFSIFVTALVFLCSLIYPAVIYESYSRLIEAANTKGLTEMSIRLNNSKTSILQLLVLSQLIFTSLAFVISVFQSHRIAGPIYKLRMYLAKVREGNAQDKLFFRKNDNFKEIAEEYNLAMESIYKTIYEKNEMLEKLNLEISEKALNSEGKEKEFLNSLLNKVSEIQSHQSHS